jgi:RimJ/RimL family protein N-acetyltransferase
MDESQLPFHAAEPQLKLQLNSWGQTIGAPLPAWVPRERPARDVIIGQFCRLEPLDPERHAVELFSAFSSAPDQRMWTYLPYGPFESAEHYAEWCRSVSQSSDPQFFAIVELTSQQPVGVASFLRIDPANGCIEVGHLQFSPRMQQTTVATEAMFLMMQTAFELGYRRYEWKCDAFNAPSRAAARRLGFQYEGLFRQAVIYKQRTRDTTWYSIIDTEWPGLRAAFIQWLSPANFDVQGRQRVRLSELTAK